MIIELIGLAGSGKTTLASSLVNRSSAIRIEPPPSYYKIKNLPFYVQNALVVFPNFFPCFMDKSIHFSLWNHIVLNIHINGWHKLLRETARKSKVTLLLDQGPLYMMNFEMLFGFGKRLTNGAKKIWERAYHSWAETLDMVIWLDASTELLIDRIRSREKWHGVKGSTDQDAVKYMETCRKLYETVVSNMMANSSNLKVINLDTGLYNLDECAEIVLQRINR